MNVINFGPGAYDLPSPDPLRLTQWLGNKTESKSIKLIDIRKLDGGALHENWICRYFFEDGLFEGRQEFVLRMAPLNKLPQSLTLNQEYKLLRFLNETNILVPKVFFLAPPSTISDNEVLVMQALKGTSRPLELMKNAHTIKNQNTMTRLLGQHSARIHNIQPKADILNFLTTPKVSPVHQNLLLFEKILDSLSSPLPLLEWAVRWLNKNEPTERETRLSHGDLRVGNIMFNNTSLTGILDWEFASWSDPLEDIGWLCARCWRYGNDNKRVGGIGELNDFISAYDEISNSTINWSNLPYWEILATVKWALIAHQQGQRNLSDRKKRLELLLTEQKADEIEYDILNQIKTFDGSAHAK